MYQAHPIAANGKKIPIDARYGRSAALLLAVASIALLSPLSAKEPPKDLARRAAERETQSEAVRANFAFTQKILIEEFGKNNIRAGAHREQREVLFSPGGDRSEKQIGKVDRGLARLQLTEEDFHDLREIQPLLLTKDRLWLYQTAHRGEEEIQKVPCWVLEVKPRQILDGQRLFEGLLWISQTDYSVVQAEGRAVPQILGTKQENLFPYFRTIRTPIHEGYWFPAITVADDTLPFRSGPLRMRMRIEYNNYKRFGSETVIRYELPPEPSELKKR